MKILNLILISLIFHSFVNCVQKNNDEEQQLVIVGADRLVSEYLYLIENKSIGLITNNTGLLSNGVHLVDTLVNIRNVTVKVLFGPEHGIRGDAPDGSTISDEVDTKTGVKIVSLYGQINKPTPEMLEGIDILIYDIQDVGVRFYTYISTMYYALEAAAENNIKIIVLDRPNPIGGIQVDGPIRDDELTSFVGIAPIPIMYGMTIGELAKMFNEGGMLKNNLKADLTILEMKNWKREYYYDDCKIRWIKTSPNIPDVATTIVYPGMCLIEGLNVSEGRGTYTPFITIGAPFINAEELIEEIKSLGFEGIELVPTKFTPKVIPNMASSPKYESVECYGIKIQITDRKNFEPVEFGIKVIYALFKLYPDKVEFRENSINRLFGKKYLAEMIIEGKTPEQIINKWQDELNTFKEYRTQFLLY
ncbi:MAG: DUF1343 domain-containing protein [Ignavibacteriales bacterium]|nr:DUF1343 domain-containing protein [Ignavibacteriales bacterium]